MRYVLIPVYVNSNRIMNIVRKCLSTYWEYAGVSKLVVVDDCSPIQIPLDVSTRLSTGENKGFTGCVNTGLEYILKKAKDDDVVYVVNDDVEFVDGWDELDNYLTDDVGIVSPLVSDEPWMVGEDVKFGSFWAIKVKTLKKVGLLDSRFKHFFSDTDMFQRIKAEGLRIIKTEEIRIPHLGNQTYGEMSGDGYEKDKQAYLDKYGRID